MTGNKSHRHGSQGAHAGMQVVGKERLPRKWMLTLGCGQGHNTHKHRAPQEPPQTEEGRVVREGLLGKVMSRQSPVAHGGPGQRKPKLVVCSGLENQVENMCLGSGWALARPKRTGRRTGDGHGRRWQGPGHESPGSCTKNSVFYLKGYRQPWKGSEQGRNTTRRVF